MKLLARFKRSKDNQKQSLKPTKLTKSVEKLVEIIFGDSNKELINQSIEQIDDPQILTNIIQSDKNHPYITYICQFAQKRFAQLLDDGKLLLDDGFNGEHSTELLAKVSLFVHDRQLFSKMAASFSEQQMLLIATRAEAVHIRLIAAASVKDTALLKELLKKAKNSDKSVYKLIKEKIHQINHRQKLEIENNGKIKKLLNSLEKHSQHAYEPLYEAKLVHLKSEWSLFKEFADNAQLIIYNDHLKKCQKKVDEQHQQRHLAELEILEKANAESEEQQILTELRLMLAALYTADDTEKELIQEIPHQLNLLLTKWQSIRPDDKPSHHQKMLIKLEKSIENMTTHFTQFGSTIFLIDRLNSKCENSDELLVSLEARVEYSYLVEEQPSNFTKSALLAVETYKKHEAGLKRQHEKQKKRLQGLLNKGLISSSKGSLKETQGIANAIEKVLPKISVLPEYLQKKLKDFDDSRKKLIDWKDFAVSPKKDELINKMELLRVSGLPVEQLANSIKSLQNQWRLLSKGGKMPEDDRWKKFKTLSDEAYQPCKQYFAEKEVTRKDNTDKRNKIIEQISEFYKNFNWDEIDARYVQSVLKTARNEWLSFHLVEYKSSKSMQHKFDKIMDAIYKKIQISYEANIQSKQEIIEQAKHLLELSTTKESIEKAKQLQQKWKSIGQIPIKIDNKLWDEFRNICNKIFENRNLKNKEYQAQLDDNLKQAQQIINTLDSLCVESQVSLEYLKQQSRQLQHQFLSIKMIPKAKVHSLNQKFEQVLEKVKAKGIELENLESSKRLKQILKDSDDYHAKYTDMQKNSENIIAQKEFFDSILKDKKLPGNIKKSLLNKFKSEDDLVDEEVQLNILRAICIRVEILNNCETPPEDQQRRLTIQVKNLQQGFKGGCNKDTPDSLIAEWTATYLVNSPLHQSLYQRFLAGLNL